jgi:hypothetical protein
MISDPVKIVSVWLSSSLLQRQFMSVLDEDVHDGTLAAGTGSIRSEKLSSTWLSPRARAPISTGGPVSALISAGSSFPSGLRQFELSSNPLCARFGFYDYESNEHSFNGGLFVRI